MRKLLLSATVVALSVNLATNISYAQTIITEGANTAIEADVTGETGTEYGGAYQNSGTMTIGTEQGDAITISGNSVTTASEYGYGGFVQSGGDKSQLTIYDNVTFNGNTASLAGGALSLNGGLKTAIHDAVTFTGNKAEGVAGTTYGGAIYITTARDELNLEMGHGTQFTSNEAGSGGAIYSNDAQIQIGSQANFSGNKATAESGGAIYSFDSDVQASKGVVTVGEEATFDKNEAAWSGGAIANFDGKVDISQGAQFTTNKALDGNGGAIANNVSVGTVKDTQLNIAGNTTFSGNSVASTSEGYGRGGAIYNAGTVNLDSTEGNITFQNNTASDTGRDVYLADNSVMNVTGSNTVSFQSGEGAIAGTGAINKTGEGTFELVNSDISNSYTGTYTQEAGTLLLDGSTMSNNFDIKDGNLVLHNGSKLFLSENGKIANGTITVGDSVSRAAGDASVLTLKKGGQIASVVDLILQKNDEVVIETDSSLIYGGQGGDLWAGKVTLKGGTLNYEGLDTNGQLVAETGNLNINNGTLNVAGADAQNASSIASDVVVDIKDGTTMVVGENGTVTINSNDKWVGDVKVDGSNASLTIDGMTSNGGLTATTGSVNLAGGSLTLANGSSIANAVNTTITGDVNIADGSLALNSGDSWTGNITVNDTNASLTIDGMTSNGGLTATTGSVNLAGGSLTLANGSSIANTVNTTITGDVNIADGSLALNNGDIWTGNITVDNADASLTIDGMTSNGGLTATTGSVNLAGGSLTLANGSSIADTVNTTITGDVNLTGGSLALNGTDSWTGNINQTDGQLDYSLTQNCGLTASGGIINVTDSSKLTLVDGSSISGTTETNVTDNSTLTVGNNGSISGGTTTVESGSTITITSGGEISGGMVDAQSGSTFNNTGTITDGADIDIATSDATNSGEIAGGTVDIANGGALENSGTISGGTTTIASGGSVTVTADGEITGGTVDAQSGSTFNNAGIISDGADIDIATSDATNSGEIAGGTVDIANGGALENSGTISGGTTTIANGGSVTVTAGGEITGGTTNVAGTLINNGDIIAGDVNVTGTVNNNNNIGGNTNLTIDTNGNVIVGDGATVDTKGAIEIATGGTLTINEGGEATLKENDIWDGDIVNTNGTLTLVGRDDSGKNYSQTGGELVLDGSEFELGGSISGGTVTVSNGSSFDVLDGATMTGGDVVFVGQGNTVNVDGEVTADAKYEINNDNIINIKENGSFVASDNDIWTDGTIEVNGGKLDFQGTVDEDGNPANGLLEANTGEVDINSEFTMVDGSYIAAVVNTDINKDTTLEGGSSLELNTGDTWASDATITVDGGKLVYDDLTSNGTIEGESGTIEINSGNMTVADGSYINNAVNTTIGDADDTSKNATVDITQGGSVQLNQGDDWNSNGTITINGGSLEYALQENGKIQANTGELDIVDGATLTMVDANDVIAEAVATTVDGTVDIQTGSVTLNNNDIWSDGTVKVNGGSFDFKGTVDAGGNAANGLLIANSGNVSINSDFTLQKGGSIAAAVNTTINDDTTLVGGSSLELNTGDSWASDATVTVDGGKLVYSDLTSNGHIDANTGALTVKSGTLTVDDQSEISSGVNTAILTDAIVDITGGKVSLNDNDSWDGTVTINGGSLEYAMQENGKVQANTGDLTIVDGATLTMADTNDVIADVVDATITGTLNVQNGNATLNDNDIWTGTVHVSDDGILNLNNVVNGTLIADGGTLNFQNGELNITGDSIITGDATTNLTQGTVNINNGTNGGGSVTLNDGDSWAADTTINLGQGGKLDYDLTSNGTLKADGGQLTTQDDSQLTLNGDSYINKEVTANLAGDTTIQNGATVDLGNDGTTTVGGNDILTGDVTIDNGGTLNLFNDVTMKDPVAGAVNQSIAVNGTMNLETTGELHLNADLSGAGDINKNGEGDVWFHGQNGGYTGTILVDNGGDLLFENGLAGNLVFGDIDGKTIGIHADEITGDLTQDREATIKYTTYHDDVDLDLNGNIDVTKGTLIAESKGDQNINFGGTVNVASAADAQNPVSMDATSNGTITFGNTVDVNNATMNVGSKSGTIFQNNITLTDSILNATSGAVDFAGDLVFNDDTSIFNSMNGQVNANTINNLDITNSQNANFQIDISSRDWKHDSFDLNNLAAANGGKININDWQFIGKAPIDRHIKINVFDVDDVDPTLLGQIEFTQTDKQIFTPIGWYQMFNQKQLNPITGAYESIPGAMTASLVEYNPQVFRGQVSTVASYANQLVTNNILFDHIFTVSNQLLAENNANKYAAIYPQFAPYQYSRKDGSLWYKAYGTLETLHMNRGLDVDNTAYGALVGADFPVIEMKKGWSFLPTAYVGYNGAHQNYSGVGMYQNGGQLGAMGTFMKDDFLGSLLLYGGGYGNQMDVAGYHDHTGNWFVGTAAKAAYNFHPTKHFTIQPTLLASYNYFHTQNWYTEFGDMRMNAGRLNGVNIAPGLNLIYGRETWSMYATIQYMFNILGTSSGNAGNVVLPDMRMQRSYIEYGVGATKTWKDRFSAYLQITVRNIGRTGIGFQGGFTFKL